MDQRRLSQGRVAESRRRAPAQGRRSCIVGTSMKTTSKTTSTDDAKSQPAPADLGTTAGVQTAFRERGYITDGSLATAVFLALQLERPLLLEGEAGVGKTGARQGAGGVPRRQADPAAVLRGPRRQHGGLRVELPPPDARDPPPRGARRGDGARHLRAGVPDPAAAAPGPRIDRRRPAGAADRRDRPRRRGVRGVPPRDPVRLPGHRARDRDDQGRAPAARDPHLEPDARGPRRARSGAACTTGSTTRPRPRSSRSFSPECPPRRRRLRGASWRSFIASAEST